PTDLVRAIGLAKARADAAIVNLHIEPLAVMNGGLDGADRLARRLLAMHAGNRLEADPPVGPAQFIGVDPQPVHVAVAGDFLRSDDRNVVLDLAGDDAGVAADAGGGVDHHGPARIGPRVIVLRIKRGRVRLASREIRESVESFRGENIFPVAIDLELFLRGKKARSAVLLARFDASDGPQRLGGAQGVSVRSDPGSDMARLRSSVAEVEAQDALGAAGI